MHCCILFALVLLFTSSSIFRLTFLFSYVYVFFLLAPFFFNLHISYCSKHKHAFLRFYSLLRCGSLVLGLLFISSSFLPLFTFLHLHLCFFFSLSFFIFIISKIFLKFTLVRLWILLAESDCFLGEENQIRNK